MVRKYYDSLKKYKYKYKYKYKIKINIKSKSKANIWEINNYNICIIVYALENIIMNKFSSTISNSTNW